MSEGEPKKANLEVWICDGHTPVIMIKPHRSVIDRTGEPECVVEAGFTPDQLQQIARAITTHFRQLQEEDLEVARSDAELEVVDDQPPWED
jgi:hypothetical protein